MVLLKIWGLRRYRYHWNTECIYLLHSHWKRFQYG